MSARDSLTGLHADLHGRMARACRVNGMSRGQLAQASKLKGEHGIPLLESGGRMGAAALALLG